MSQNVAGPTLQDEDGHSWRERSRVVLTPVAAPTILGWLCFAVAAALFGSHEAGWWGGPGTLLFLAPFLAFFGLGQLLAGMWSYRARDPIATAVHGVLGVFWIALAISEFAFRQGPLTAVGMVMPLGVALLVIGVTILGGTIAALRENVVLALLLALVTVASVVTGLGLMTTSTVTTEIGGYFYVAGAVVAWYLATAIMVAEATGRQMLPIGPYRQASMLPGEPISEVVAFSTGSPTTIKVPPARHRRSEVSSS